MNWLAEIIGAPPAPLPPTPAPRAVDARAWSNEAAAGPPSNADPAAWAAGMLDRLDGGMYYLVPWPTFLKLERLEKRP